MSIADKVGVCLSLADTTGPCRYPDKLDEAMQYLGLDMIRTRAPQAGADSWRIYKAVAGYGYRFLFTHRAGRDPIAEVRDIQELNHLYPGCVIAYEGPNEPDLNPVTFAGVTDKRRVGSSWTGKAALALMQAQRNALRQVSALNKVQVVAFNDWMQAEQGSSTNLANSHIYPNNKVLVDYLPDFESKVALHGRGQGVITEWGYHNAVGEHQTSAGISEAQAAKNYPADVSAILVNKKIKYAFIYCGVDGYGTGEFNRFGLFRSDWTPKPAAKALYNMKQ
jgi:hypothetical protein